MTPLAITQLLGLVVLVSGYPMPLGHGPDIFRDGFGGQGLDGSIYFGDLDFGHRHGYWDSQYADGNFVFDRPDGIMNRIGISGENWADIYDGYAPVSNYHGEGFSDDVLLNYDRYGAAFGVPIRYRAEFGGPIY